METIISLSHVEKFVSKYEICSSCGSEAELDYRYPHETEITVLGVSYYFDHCCNFPVDELNKAVWKKIIEDWETGHGLSKQTIFSLSRI